MKLFGWFFVFFALQAQANQPAVRIKNFREIYYSLSALTGISENDPDIKVTYQLVKDRLPKSQSPLEFGSPSLLALTELAGAFCKKAVDKESTQSAGERILFPDINFTRGPVQFSSYLNETISKRMARIFWQKDVRANEVAIIEKFVFEASKANLESVDETKKAVQGICTTFASSLAYATK